MGAVLADGGTEAQGGGGSWLTRHRGPSSVSRPRTAAEQLGCSATSQASFLSLEITVKATEAATGWPCGIGGENRQLVSPTSPVSLLCAPLSTSG